jgi:hypothetical protein
LTHLPVHLLGLGLCLTILIVTVFEKFAAGGWLTLVVTGILVAVCLGIKQHYNKVVTAIRRLDDELVDPLTSAPASKPSVAQVNETSPVSSLIDRKQPVAVLFVGPYGGLGRHALLTMLRMFPGHFKGIVFCSVAVVDSGSFKGLDEVHALEGRVQHALDQYVRYAAWLGLPADSMYGTGIEVAVVAEHLGTSIIEKYPRSLFVAGQLIFDEDSFVTRVLHNETAFMIQRRLQHAGVPMIVLPVRLTLKEGPRLLGPSMTEERLA